ncbi:MAG: TRAP transporter TatT component family protein [Calditrichaceae bacterium]
MNKYSLITLLMLILSISSCSLNQIVIRQMEPILQQSSNALYEESDLQLAEQALAANLKLVEGLLKNDPENEKLLLLLAQGYSGYALGFIEDTDPDRAKVFYSRARDYALTVLRKDKAFKEAENADFEKLSKVVNSYGDEKVPPLFWAGFAGAGYLNLDLGNPMALMELPKIQLFMDRVEAVEPSFYYGAVYLYQGSVLGMKPIMMGGNPQKAKEYFEKNLELNQKKFLLAYIYMAKYYAAKVLNEELFDQYIKTVQDAPVDILPEMTLISQIAKRKAELLIKSKEDIF